MASSSLRECGYLLSHSLHALSLHTRSHPYGSQIAPRASLPVLSAAAIPPPRPRPRARNGWLFHMDLSCGRGSLA